jgi:hypothetical protein
MGSSHWLLYRPKVLYSYVVEGVSFRAERIAMGEVNSSIESSARKKADAYKPGMAVDVWYDPKEPSSATLSLSSPYWVYFLYAIFLLGCGVAVGSVVWLFRLWQHSGWAAFRW